MLFILIIFIRKRNKLFLLTSLKLMDVKISMKSINVIIIILFPGLKNVNKEFFFWTKLIQAVVFGGMDWISHSILEDL